MTMPDDFGRIAEAHEVAEMYFQATPARVWTYVAISPYAMTRQHFSERIAPPICALDIGLV